MSGESWEGVDGTLGGRVTSENHLLLRREKITGWGEQEEVVREERRRAGVVEGHS